MIRSLLLWLLRAYRAVLSPWMGGQCRFEPSCSRYATACVERFGAGVEPPDGAQVFYDGVDDVAGPLLKYAWCQADAHA